MAAYQRGAYQLFAYQIAANPTYTTTLMPGGPAYTRKRHRDLLEVERALQRAEHKAREARNAKQRAVALAAEQEARRQVLEAREREAEQWADLHRQAALHQAHAALTGSQAIARAFDTAAQLHHAAQLQRPPDDDDEAIALLLLH